MKYKEGLKNLRIGNDFDVNNNLFYKKRTFSNVCLLILILFFVPVKSDAASTYTKQQCFEYVFGSKAKLDPAMVKKVGSDLSGKRYYVDKNNDGRPEEVWYVDVDPRHTESLRPMLVKCIDRDGDMTMNGEGDYDSDLYVVDYNADGTVDAVVSYEDLDGDQDVDRMGVFYYEEKTGLCVWWSRDDGDDNKLWYTKDYAYYQRDCEFRNHFGGDETFNMFFIKPGDKEWTPRSESPFCFFDCDGDGLTEEVVRVVGEGNAVRSIRWSFDADNDATDENQHDYDVSLTAVMGTGKSDIDNEKITDKQLTYGGSYVEEISIEGFPAKMMRRSHMRDFLRNQIWSNEMFTWDENDLNIPYRVPGYTLERWEGVIASESKEKNAEMPRVGWPDAGPVNKRYEVLKKPKAANAYYFSAGDRRIHIKSFDKSWLKVDYDYDSKVDMAYEWKDTNKDGIADKMFIDIDGDGKWDDAVTLDVSADEAVDWNFNSINCAYGKVVSKDPERLYKINRQLMSALEKKSAGSGKDSVWDMIENRMRCKELSDDLSQRLVSSNESMLYYLRLSADRRIAKLKSIYKNKKFWTEFNELRGRGDLSGLSALMTSKFGNISSEDLNYGNWLSNLRKVEKKKSVAWCNNWFAPNWGWESEKAAFRCYDGHFDLFGKRHDFMLMPTLENNHDIKYHVDHNTWGMDILHVGPTGGCGGMMLYVNGKAYPTHHDKDGDPVWTPKLVQCSDDSVTIGFTVTGIGPKDSPYTMYVNCTARAGHYEDMRDVRFEGGKPGDEIEMGVVINKIPYEEFFLNEKAGIMGLWGFQDPAMGWIGMGVMFPPDRYICQSDSSDEYRAVLRIKKGETLRFYAQGDWLRGHRFVPGGGVKEWQETLLKQAHVLHLK